MEPNEFCHLINGTLGLRQDIGKQLPRVKCSRLDSKFKGDLSFAQFFRKMLGIMPQILHL